MIIISVCLIIIYLYTFKMYRSQTIATHYVDKLLNEFNTNANLKNNSDIFVFLLIPAVSEQNVIKDTLSYFLKSYHGNFKILLTLDQKELPDQNGITTKAAVLDFIKTGADPKNIIEIIEYRGPYRGRAYQLNEALFYIKNIATKNNISIQKIWVGVYNADSTPHPQTLDYLLWKLTRCPDIKVFQQLLDYRSNANELRDNPLMLANSFCQTARNLIFEVSFVMHAKTSYPPYCMGNGEFIRFDTLMTIGGFSTRGPCDGIQLGVCLTLAGYSIEILPFAELCQSPPSLRLMIQQHCMWFGGIIAVFKHLVAKKQYGWYLTLKRIFNYLMMALIWLLSPFVFIFLILYCLFYIVSGNFFMLIPLFLIATAVFLYVRLILKSNKKFTPRPNPFWIPLSILTRPIGPWLFIYKYIKSVLTNKPMTYKKMER